MSGLQCLENTWPNIPQLGMYVNRNSGSWVESEVTGLLRILQ